MSNKPFSKLLDADRTIRTIAGRAGPGHEGTLLTIEYVGGFEMFNTRPYHNYESWGDGYRVSGGKEPCWSCKGNEEMICSVCNCNRVVPIVAEAEDLDDALAAWTEKAIEQAKNRESEKGASND